MFTEPLIAHMQETSPAEETSLADTSDAPLTTPDLSLHSSDNSETQALHFLTRQQKKHAQSHAAYNLDTEVVQSCW